MILDAQVEAARENQIQIITSTVTLPEVAYVRHERDQRRLDPAVEDALDNLFGVQAFLQFVEYDLMMGIEARHLIRRTMVDDRSLKPVDAVHLASAVATGADVFYSYDQRLRSLATDYKIIFAAEPSFLDGYAPPLPGLGP